MVRSTRQRLRRGRPRGNLKEEAAQYLRDCIYAGELRPGDRIDQDAIAEQLGMSRLPVREAIISLEADGLIDNIPRRGAFVASLTPQDVLDTYEVYGTLAGLAASRAATALTAADLNTLDELIEAMESSTDNAEQEALNYEFHRVINTAGASRRLRLALRALAAGMPSRFFEFTDDWNRQAIIEHRAIVAALRSRDPEAARKAASDHLRSGAEQAVAMLRASGFWAERDTTPSG
ncbi:transcriptional regulator, GntR family [Pseudonocardia thermophila]|mgnify:CR=1 FL=1|jgi:Transcriptional regulators|uniref:Transcriptional regulator, GntR family n=1 Tax=Pseudonocardia thermophila TaxID=1848 RepID=A0A1M6UV05_PSETH|nr:GntR family transcriptional regulator [Pseudonocardia thermophila]SHK73057.1 transcriptional regulator, GntR family [Pseudonocardia thermophila]